VAHNVHVLIAELVKTTDLCSAGGGCDLSDAGYVDKIRGLHGYQCAIPNGNADEAGNLPRGPPSLDAGIGVLFDGLKI
jgi:hypothetical protein